MTDPASTPPSFGAFLATARSRLITAPTVVVLALGIVADVISIMTGYYNMKKVRAEADKATVEAQALIQPTIVPGSQHEAGGHYASITITSVDNCNNHPALNTNNPKWDRSNQRDCGIGARLAKVKGDLLHSHINMRHMIEI